jgi:hypothetical protein
MTMVRKQLYIDLQQDALLKRKARELGLSEAEVVRRALDTALNERVNPTVPSRSLLKELLDDARAFSLEHQPPESYIYKREDAYSNEQRLERWGSDLS